MSLRYLLRPEVVRRLLGSWTFVKRTKRCRWRWRAGQCPTDYVTHSHRPGGNTPGPAPGAQGGRGATWGGEGRNDGRRASRRTTDLNVSSVILVLATLSSRAQVQRPSDSVNTFCKSRCSLSSPSKQTVNCKQLRPKQRSHSIPHSDVSRSLPPLWNLIKIGY